MYVCVRGGQRLYQVSSLITVPYVSIQGLSLSLELTNSAGCLCSEFQESACLPLRRMDYRHKAPCSGCPHVWAVGVLLTGPLLASLF